MNWQRRIRRWHKRNTVGIIETSDLGFTVHFCRKSTSMKWAEVVKIEVGRQPTGFVEIFFVILSADSGRWLKVADTMEGFSQFQEMIFQRWPEAKDRWVQVFTGPPDIAGLATVWLLDRQSY